MESAKGTSLNQTWSDMKLPEKVGTIRNLVAIQQKLLGVSFSRFAPLCRVYAVGR